MSYLTGKFGNKMLLMFRGALFKMDLYGLEACEAVILDFDSENYVGVVALEGPVNGNCPAEPSGHGGYENIF